MIKKYDDSIESNNSSKYINSKINLKVNSKDSTKKQNNLPNSISNSEVKTAKKKSTIMVDESVDLEFRKIASSKFNFCRGWYTKAINEALEEWIENNR